MARRQLTKRGLVSSTDSNDFVQAGLFTIRDNGSVDYSRNDLALFLLNPESWEESKSSNWIQHLVPGQSDPILQWIHSGPRVVTFEALVTEDTSDFNSYKADINSNASSSNSTLGNFFAGIAASFFNIAVPASRQALTNTQRNTNNFDISDKLNYYRSLLYPVYDDRNNPQKLKFSPPLVLLKVGSTFSKDKDISSISTDTDVWVVTNIRIKVTKQLPNLTPMEAMVAFELTQYTIKSLDRGRFF